ncbi:MAG: hypothetical protein ACRESG_00200, partial [Gammaproteobacteria bacterium]
MRFRRSRRWLLWLGLVVVLAVTALAYWPGTHSGFMFDDYPNIVENPALKIEHLTPAAIARAAFSMPSVGTFERPIAMASFALSDYFNGMQAQPMKIVNLAIHLLNGVLVFLLLRLLLGEYARLRNSGSGKDIPLDPPSQAKGEEAGGLSQAKGEEAGGPSQAKGEDRTYPLRNEGGRRAAPGG